MVNEEQGTASSIAGEFCPWLDTLCATTLAEQVTTLSLAFFFSGNESYATVAAQALRVWFLDNRTKMNENLEYAAIYPGVNNGSASGIILTTFRWNTQLTDSAVLLRASKSWSKDDDEQLRAWMQKYLRWLRTSSHGQTEQRADNNHGTWFAVETMAMAIFTGNITLAGDIASRMKNDENSALSKQILPSGQMPLETRRADSINYNTMNMAGLFTLATAAQQTSVGDQLWSFRGPSGAGSIQQALRYLLPFAVG